MSRTISLTVKDSIMNAYVAVPRGSGPFPAVIVFHDAFGVNAEIRGVADKLAREGFVVIAPELFHRTAEPGFEARYYQVPAVMPHVNAMKQEQITEDMQAAFKWLRTQDNVNENGIGSIGFSLGGRFSFIANSQLKLKASVSVYGGQLHKELERVPKLRGAQLFVWGGNDEYISRTQSLAITNAVRDAGKDCVSLEFSNAKHSFFYAEHPAYDAGAAIQTWAVAKEFLKYHLQA